MVLIVILDEALIVVAPVARTPVLEVVLERTSVAVAMAKITKNVISIFVKCQSRFFCRELMI